MLASEYSSGCESGWTLYFEESFLSPNSRHRVSQFVGTKNGCFLNKGTRNVAHEDTQVGGAEEDIGEEDQQFDDDDDEDLSMVSDASSGPALFHEDNNFEDFVSGRKRHNKDGNEKKCHGKDLQDMASMLDDTASSPAFNFSKSCFAHSHNQTSMESDLEYSQGFSATYFEGRSAYWENFGYVQPSYSRNNQLQNN